MSNPTNEQELREWLAEYATSYQGDSYYSITPDDVSNYEVEELQALITAYTNAEIARTLDTSATAVKALELADYDDADPYQQGYMWAIGQATSAIQAERAKLKEVK